MLLGIHWKLFITKCFPKVMALMTSIFLQETQFQENCVGGAIVLEYDCCQLTIR